MVRHEMDEDSEQRRDVMEPSGAGLFPALLFIVLYPLLVRCSTLKRTGEVGALPGNARGMG